jgi:N-acetylmuramoyl-L-alanine amidase
MVAFNEIAYHAGKSTWKGLSSLNRYAVGIEIVNWGVLQGGPDQWTTWTGKPVPRDRVLVAGHKNCPATQRGWELFDEVQIAACVTAARAIVNAYGLSPIDIIGHDDIAPGRKTDPGPAFDMVRFRSHVFGREDDVDVNPDEFAVRSMNGLNMRKSPDLGGALIKTLADHTQVRVIEKQGRWWMVAELVNGTEDVTGWVHSKWLVPA